MAKQIVNFLGSNREEHDEITDFIGLYNSTQRNEDITVFPDRYILEYISGNVISNPNSIKIALFKEPLTIGNQKNILNSLLANYQKFDKIVSWHKELEHLPNYVFKPATELTQLNSLPDPLPVDQFKIHPKSKLVSFVTSNKLMCEGHLFRLQCLEQLHINNASYDLYGRGFNPIDSKLEALVDYAFSIAIENGEFINGYTEKIMDCFLTGTVPIYHGCPNIGDFYDERGIIYFNTKEELLNIVNNLTMNQYLEKLPYIKHNLEVALEDYQTNNRIYHKFFK